MLLCRSLIGDAPISSIANVSVGERSGTFDEDEGRRVASEEMGSFEMSCAGGGGKLDSFQPPSKNIQEVTQMFTSCSIHL